MASKFEKHKVKKHKVHKHKAHKHKAHMTCGCVQFPVAEEIFKSLQELHPNPLANMRAMVAKAMPSIYVPDSKILYNGTIRTMVDGDANKTVAAIAFHDDAIVHAGTLEECREALPFAEEHDLKGKTVLPGLVEPHLHLLSASMMRSWVDLSPYKGQNLIGDQYTSEYCFKKMKDEAKKLEDSGNPDGKWVLGYAMDPSLFNVDPFTKWENPSKNDLDENVSTSVPVLIMNASGHIAYANSLALEKTDVSDSDGILLEIEEFGPVLSQALVQHYGSLLEFFSTVLTTMHTLLKEASSRGITMMWDASLGTTHSKLELDFFKVLTHTNACPIRYGGAVLFENEGALEHWRKAGVSPTTYNTPRFNVTAAKIVSDGSNQGLTGYQYHDYPNPDEYINISTGHMAGVWNFPESNPKNNFQRLVKNLDSDGWNLMIHANGDKAITQVLDGYENAIQKNAARERRHRIEHCSLMDKDLAARMNQLGISPSFLIGHVGYWGYTFENKVWDEKTTSILDSTRTALDNDLRLTLHSDHFVSPLGPLRMIEQAVSRRKEFFKANDKVLNAAECLTIAEGLKAVTYDAAWQCSAEKVCGSLETGKKADLVILADDPMKWRADGVGLRNLAVVETWMDGRRTYASVRSR